MYKACIFDLDGTLTNTLDSLTYSTNKTLEEMGLETITKLRWGWSQMPYGTCTSCVRRHRA